LRFNPNLKFWWNLRAIDKGIAIKARYISTLGAQELGPSIDVVEI
jgi:hypothetical protein